MNVAAYSTYDNYKDSGVEWLGHVPSSWTLTRLGSVFDERKSKVSDKNFEPLSVTKNGIFPQLETAAKANDGDNRKLVKAGDFVINSRSDRKGSSGVSLLDGSVSLINIVLKPTGILPEFCNHILKSYVFVEEYYRMGHGIVADLWTTRYDEMRAIVMALPPLLEQRTIAAFLDEKCAKIDEAVRIKEEQIALLRERRQILIQAVTRGLNPNAPMKDSGIDWIGKIPAHWEVKKVKHFGRNRSGDGVTNSQLTDEGVYEVWGGNGLMGFSDKFNVDGDYIVIGRVGAYCGNIRRANGKRWVSDNALILRTSLAISSAFLAHVLQAADLNRLNESNAQPLITGGKVSNLSIPFPPIVEQDEIVDHIRWSSQKIEDGIAIKERQIATLKEYRTSLINAAVTGKIKVA